MEHKPGWYILTSTFYFTCWFTLIVVYHLTGWAQVAGGLLTLFALKNILGSDHVNFRHSL